MNEDTATEQNAENAENGTAKPAEVQAAAAADAKPAPAPEDKPAKISGVAYTGGAIRQGWNPDPVVVDLAGMTVPAKVPLIRDHSHWNTDNRLGNVTARKTARGIEIEGEIVSGTESAREIVRQGKLGADWQLSIGAEISAAERVIQGARTVNGRTFQAPFILATKTTLREVSVVAVGADRSTNLHVAAAFTPTPNLHIKMEEKDTKPVEAAAPTAPAAPAPVFSRNGYNKIQKDEESMRFIEEMIKKKGKGFMEICENEKDVCIFSKANKIYFEKLKRDDVEEDFGIKKIEELRDQ